MVSPQCEVSLQLETACWGTESRPKQASAQRLAGSAWLNSRHGNSNTSWKQQSGSCAAAPTTYLREKWKQMHGQREGPDAPCRSSCAHVA